MAGAASGSAPEHARQEWRTPGPDWTFTWERAQLVPQVDRLGKKAIRRIVEHMLLEGDLTPVPFEITSGERIRWWLWICNLGRFSREVVGVGVNQAWVASEADNEFVFTFKHIDDTVCHVNLGYPQRRMGRELQINI